MRAYQLSRLDGIDSLRSVELPPPKPGRRQILVRVMACSLNARDLIIAEGGYPGPIRQDLIPLSDAAGDVVEIGSDVSRFAVGDRVMGSFYQRWVAGAPGPDTLASALGAQSHGVLADYVVLEDTGAVPLPAHLSYAEGACLPCAGLTAWQAVVEHGQAKPGHTVLVQGTGGVSIFALQIARMFGAAVAVTSSSKAKLEKAVALGATVGINYVEQPNWGTEIAARTGGVDHVVEVGGAGTLTQSLAALRMSGRITIVGALAGGAGNLDTMAIRAKRANLQGISVGSLQMFETMALAFAAHGTRPVIDSIFGFEDAAGAFRRLQSASHVGKVVIRVNG